ncbi:MAG: HAMP domain-containing protein [Candidatus Omnitrophica bacterium]|nr:HAMP domain-containing protein [Candidatus Omnitrophota bacterium]
MGFKSFFHYLTTKRIDISFSDLRNEQVHVRLIIAIPLIIMVLVIGYGIIYLGVFHTLLTTSSESTGQVEHLFQALTSLKRQLIGSVLVSFVVGIFLAYAIVLPLQKITIGARTVSSGDLTKTLNINQDDEIGALGRAFNEMLLSLNRYFLNSITGAALTLNKAHQVIGFNETAELALGRSGAGVVGRHVSTLFPRGLNEKFYALLDEAMGEGRTHSQTELTLAMNKYRSIPVSLTTSLLKKEDDSILGLIVNFQDIDKIKNENRQAQIMSKLTSLGTLAAGLAHEIKNPLASIKGLAELIREEVDPADHKRKYADTIIKEMDKLNKAVETILDFAQQKPLEKHVKLINVNELLDETIELLLHGIKGDGIRIIKEYAGRPVQLLGDTYRLQQAFLNMALNAVESMPEGGTFTVSTGMTHEGGRPMARITLTDTGKGIAPEIIDRIFDPFFTTDPAGTGLGLSIAHQAIISHEGHIEVASRPEEGSAFSVYLPAKEDA